MGETTLELSEAEDRIKELEERNRDLDRKLRRESVEKRVKELGDLGLSEFPGFLKEVRNIMLSDDGQPALMLSEDGSGSNAKEQSATEIVERLVQALPTKDGKLALSEQAHTVEPGAQDDRPKEDAQGEKTEKERTDSALQELGLAEAVTA